MILTGRIPLPVLRYIAHISAPGLNVIGAGEPALPGISIGHNGTIAFGLTIFNIDQEDLYVYELNPSNPMQYRYKGGLGRNGERLQPPSRLPRNAAVNSA